MPDIIAPAIAAYLTELVRMVDPRRLSVTPNQDLPFTTTVRQIRGAATLMLADYLAAISAATQATCSIVGAAGTGELVVTVDAAGSAGNAFSVVVEAATGANAPLAAAIDAGVITISLGVDAGEVLDPAKNTLTLIAAAVTALAGVAAAVSGSGADTLDAATITGSPYGFAGGIG